MVTNREHQNSNTTKYDKASVFWLLKLVFGYVNKSLKTFDNIKLSKTVDVSQDHFMCLITVHKQTKEMKLTSNVSCFLGQM